MITALHRLNSYGHFLVTFLEDERYEQVYVLGGVPKIIINNKGLLPPRGFWKVYLTTCKASVPREIDEVIYDEPTLEHRLQSW